MKVELELYSPEQMEEFADFLKAKAAKERRLCDEKEEAYRREGQLRKLATSTSGQVGAPLNNALVGGFTADNIAGVPLEDCPTKGS